MQKFWNFQKGKYKAQSYSGKDACLFETEVNPFPMMKDEKKWWFPPKIITKSNICFIRLTRWHHSDPRAEKNCFKLSVRTIRGLHTDLVFQTLTVLNMNIHDWNRRYMTGNREIRRNRIGPFKHLIGWKTALNHILGYSEGSLLNICASRKISIPNEMVGRPQNYTVQTYGGQSWRASSRLQSLSFRLADLTCSRSNLPIMAERFTCGRLYVQTPHLNKQTRREPWKVGVSVGHATFTVFRQSRGIAAQLELPAAFQTFTAASA